MPEVKVGIVTHCFPKIGVAVVKATDSELAVGDTVHVKGHLTDHTQPVESLQVEHNQIEKLERGGEAGMRVATRVHENDVVFKVVP